MLSALLGRLPDLDNVDDHQPATYGALTRCEACLEMYPCSVLAMARTLAAVDTSLLETIDVGWAIQTRVPEQLDPRPIRGIVVGYSDDEDAGRTYTVVVSKHGAPTTRKIAARDVDTKLLGLPNSKSITATYRQLAAHVGRHTGSGDSTEVRNLAMALALAQTAT